MPRCRTVVEARRNDMQAAATADTVEGMANAVRDRLVELDMDIQDFVRASGLSRPGLDPVRDGVRRNYKAKTIYGVAKALRWSPDWYDRLVDGQLPTTVDEAGGLREPTMSELAAMIRENSDAIRRLAEGGLRIRSLLVEAVARLDALVPSTEPPPRTRTRRSRPTDS
jgi:hypothetical protein